MTASAAQARSGSLETEIPMRAGSSARHAMDKVKILFLAANPSATGQKTRELGVSDAAPIIANPLQLDVEFREITAAIRASTYRDSFEPVIPILAVRPGDFQQALLEHKPHIVHFSGHGSSGAEIIVHDKDGRPQPVSKEALIDLFRTLKDNIRVVVLNACWTRAQAEEIAKTIDFTIGMNRPISDGAAIVFSRSFYQAHGFGRTMQEAFDLAKIALRLEGIPEHETPERFARTTADASRRFFFPSPGAVDEATAENPVPIHGSFEDLAKEVKSAKTLVDLVWCIGNAATQWRYSKDQAETACSQYRSSYEDKNAYIKILGMSEPVELAKIYTEVRIVPPTFLRGYRTLEELQGSFLRRGRDLASYDLHRKKPRPGLKVANDERNQFLSLLGAPGAGKSTFLRYIGLMALRSDRLDATGQEPPDSTASRYRFNLLPVMLELRGVRNAPLDLAALIDDELRTIGLPSKFARAGAAGRWPAGITRRIG